MPRIARVGGKGLLAAALIAAALGVIAPAVGVAAASDTCPDGGMGPVCQLVVVAPASAPANADFEVKVLVTTDGSTIAKSDPCANGILVELDVLALGNHLVSQWGATVQAGVATFTIQVPYDWGGAPMVHSFGLRATSGDLNPPSGATGCDAYMFYPGQVTVAATIVPAEQPFYPCPPGTTCTLTANDTGSAATLIAESGTFSASWTYPTTSFYDGCGTGPIDEHGVLYFAHNGRPVPKTIVFSLDATLVTGGIGRINVCWGAPIPFYTKSGSIATLQADGWYWGVLPSCGPKDDGPCVKFRTSGQYNVAFIGVVAPEPDPKGAPIWS
jgi:hypothetical protein